jgi:hypothetical protein
VDEAAALAVEGQSPAGKERIEEFRNLLGVKALRIAVVQASEKAGRAAAVSERVKLTKANPDGRDVGCLSFQLVQVDGRWLLKDIDFDTEARAKEKLEAFVKKHPDAKELPGKPQP